jgi:hypothetical protein
MTAGDVVVLGLLWLIAVLCLVGGRSEVDR